MTAHRVPVTLPAGRALPNGRLPDVFPYTSCTGINFQGHVSVLCTVSHFVLLIPNVPVGMKEASVTENWLEPRPGSSAW